MHRIAAIALLGVGCSLPPARHASGPTLIVPTTLGEGSPQEGKAAPPPGSSAPVSASPTRSEPIAKAEPTTKAPTRDAASPIDSAAPMTRLDLDLTHAPPDPEPLRQREQWEYSIEWKAGALAVAGVRPVNLREPMVTPRRMGRYAIELWIGRELVERVRFDLPLLGADGPESSGIHTTLPPPSITKGAHVRARVLVPRAARARRALLIDRATGEALVLPWPPDQAPQAEAASGAPQTQARPNE